MAAKVFGEVPGILHGAGDLSDAHEHQAGDGPAAYAQRADGVDDDHGMMPDEQPVIWRDGYQEQELVHQHVGLHQRMRMSVTPSDTAGRSHSGSHTEVGMQQSRPALPRRTHIVVVKLVPEYLEYGQPAGSCRASDRLARVSHAQMLLADVHRRLLQSCAGGGGGGELRAAGAEAGSGQESVNQHVPLCCTRKCRLRYIHHQHVRDPNTHLE